MKQPKFSTCLCCNRTVSHEQIARNHVICELCLTMTGDQIVRTTRATAELQHKIATDTRAGRRKAKQDAKLASYLEHGKKCSTCHAYLPAESFASCAPRPDGLQASCRTCNKLQISITGTPEGRATWRLVRDTMRAKNGTK